MSLGLNLPVNANMEDISLYTYIGQYGHLPITVKLSSPKSSLLTSSAETAEI